jgi:general secretion pathway protein D
MSKDNAMRSQIPVIVGAEPDQIPMNDEIVTQIIPVRYVQARQLIMDLSSLTTSPSIFANDAGNSIVVTDTQANIHHLAELVKAIDSSAEDVTVVKSFALKYHDPVEVAGLISSVFTDQSNTQQGGGQNTPRFGAFGGFGGFGGGGLNRFFGGGREVVGVAVAANKPARTANPAFANRPK